MAHPRLFPVLCPHAKVFREIVRELRADPALTERVKTWRVMDGSASDIQPVSIYQCPALILTPAEGPDSHWGPSGFQGSIVIRVGLVTPGTNVDDLLNLFHQCRRAIFPASDTARSTYRQTLLLMGAKTGEPIFTAGPNGYGGDDTNGPMLVATGEIRIDMRMLDL